MRRAVLAGLAWTLAGILLPGAVTRAAAQERPALVVLVTVDQLRADYLDRFDGHLTGGFARLVREGTYYERALQDHAMTSTAPGHATLWSGRHPASTNIISNDLGVPDTDHPLIGGFAGDGASPRRFRGSALADWVIAADSGTRVLSVSRKDRGAILSVGSARADVYWWSKSGAFTTSTYYADTLPQWLTRWNDGFRGASWEGRLWEPLLPAARYPEPDSLAFEGVKDGREPAFPHRLEAVRDLEMFPWMDSLTLDVALTGVRTLGLGQGAGTDVLGISLSTLDAIGHDFGPDSREVHDHFVRLDHWLGAFMTELERQIPGAVLYAVSSDHGVMPMPELLQLQGRNVGRVVPERAVQRFLAPLQARYRTDFGVLVQKGIVLADTSAFRARGIDVADLAARLAALLAAQPGVARVHTPGTLEAAPADDPHAAMWRRSIPPGWGWLAAVEPLEGWSLGADIEAEHGTPLSLNVDVPLFFLGPGIPAQRLARPVSVVDVAPTLAALLGLRPTEPVDGVVLREVVHGGGWQ